MSQTLPLLFTPKKSARTDEGGLYLNLNNVPFVRIFLFHNLFSDRQVAKKGIKILNLHMAGMDHRSADLSVRSKFSLTESKVQQIVAKMKTHPSVQGCILLSTCNRSEVYLSLVEETDLDPAVFLCETLELDSQKYEGYFTRYQGEEVLDHLFLVTAGLSSQLRGDDQILTQVHTAATLAREVQGTDPILETLFRYGVSSGKKIKTEVPLYAVERSVARQGIEVIQKEIGSLAGKKALVIGNGEMGRLSARLLVESGCQVTITLRNYKRGDTIVPSGCQTIPYGERYRLIPQCDLLLSATASTHYTITRGMLEQGENIPPYIIDFAVPRDVEPAVDQLTGVTCWNVDTLIDPEYQVDPEKIKQIDEITEKYKQDFFRWYSYRQAYVRE